MALKHNHMTRFNNHTGNVACWHKNGLGGVYTEFIPVGKSYTLLEISLRDYATLLEIRQGSDHSHTVFHLPPTSSLDEALKWAARELKDVYKIDFGWVPPQPLGC